MPRSAVAPRAALTFAPATPDRWADLETLFGANGACAGCWCMWWRLARSQFQKNAGAANKRAFKRLVESGAEPGVLAYAGRIAVGWCAIEPKAAYPSLARSKTKNIDDRPAWAVTCFFINKTHRGAGLSRRLLEAAVAQARKRGAMLVEGYPLDARRRGKDGDTQKRAMDFDSFMGTADVFRRAGFVEAARPTPGRPVMRLQLGAR